MSDPEHWDLNGVALNLACDLQLTLLVGAPDAGDSRKTVRLCSVVHPKLDVPRPFTVGGPAIDGLQDVVDHLAILKTLDGARLRSSSSLGARIRSEGPARDGKRQNNL